MTSDRQKFLFLMGYLKGFQSTLSANEAEAIEIGLDAIGADEIVSDAYKKPFQ